MNGEAASSKQQGCSTEYLIRFSQQHETFRRAEIEAIAELQKLDMEVVFYDLDSPFSIVRLPSEAAAKALISRSILAQTIHELWGSGETQADLRTSVESSQTAGQWLEHSTSAAAAAADGSFKIEIDSFRGRRDQTARLALINSLAYLPLKGPIRMKSPDNTFTLFEHWAHLAVPLGLEHPERYYLGRLVGISARDLVRAYDLKKRRYISTTSMDAELALVTANMALAGPGRLFYDPFVGTGGFPLAAAHFGAVCWGSDIDGRAIRGEEGGAVGKEKEKQQQQQQQQQQKKKNKNKKTLRGNFEQYGLVAGLGGMFTADLTNSPVRRVPLALRREGEEEDSETERRRGRRLFDGIVSDPPYGVREGLMVLGCRDPEKTPWVVQAGVKMYRDPNYVPPKKPYSFFAMLDNILVFAAETLVDGGRLAFWMPTVNDEEQEIPVPTHPCLALVSVCSQVFSKWSRRLITYRRIPDADVDQEALAAALAKVSHSEGTTASELNPFRKAYFNKFEAPASAAPG